MQQLYTATASLDSRAISKYLLSDELLMENAANALLGLIERLTHRQSVVCIVCGSGDNGADGYALARKLQGNYRVRIYEAKEPKSPLCKLQAQRASLAGVEWSKKILPCDVIVDCLFGSGFSGELSPESSKLIEQMNSAARLNIACDIPSGLDLQGRVGSIAFRADYTMSMGALKAGLFADSAKDIVGEVIVGDLGISRALFEVQSPFSLLEASDLHLPARTKHNCHKGSFGHVAVVSGEKMGAAELCARAALRMGAGLVSILTRQSLESSAKKVAVATLFDDFASQGFMDSGARDYDRLESWHARLNTLGSSVEIMHTHEIPANANVLCIGMGLGRTNPHTKASKTISATHQATLATPDKSPLALIAARLDSGELGCSLVLDADVFYDKAIISLLKRHAARLVLTPHPKEFASLLQLCGLDSPNTLAEIVEQRFELALGFSQAYPEATLLLKGANPIIAQGGKLYINPLGTPALAKGGSGDVLSGLIAGFLAQGYGMLDSAINASLAHALASKREKNAYALTPLRLIEHIGEL